jgi:sugar lactone lactonase YvrE
MIDITKIKNIGTGIVRPEGVMALDDGSLYTADGKGRCAIITRTGETTFWGDLGGAPNGICIDADGNCIVANIGNGQVQSLSPDGHHEVLLTEVDGRKLPTPNFPYVDSKGRLWVSNSTQINLQESLQNPTPDGCVVLIENGKARVVADGLYFANGLTLDSKEEYLYVAESTRMDILRYRIRADGSLENPETFGPSPLTERGIPDGVAFDEAENLWVTLPSRNAIGYITPDGELRVVIEDPGKTVLHRPSNICFGWKDRKTAFIGSLDGTTIPYFEVPYPGMRLVHQKI